MWAMSLFFHEYTSDKFLFHLVSPHICVDSDTIFWWWIEDQSSLPIFVPFCVEYQFYAIVPGEEVQMGSCLLFTGFWCILLLPFWYFVRLMGLKLPLSRVSTFSIELCEVSWWNVLWFGLCSISTLPIGCIPCWGWPIYTKSVCAHTSVFLCGARTRWGIFQEFL